MPKLSILLLFLCVSISSCEDEVCYYEEPEGTYDTLEDCKKMKLPTGYTHCCLLKYSLGEGKLSSCYALNDNGYKDRNSVLNKLKKVFPTATGSIVCEGDKNASSFIKITKGLLVLLLIFI